MGKRIRMPARCAHEDFKVETARQLAYSSLKLGQKRPEVGACGFLEQRSFIARERIDAKSCLGRSASAGCTLCANGLLCSESSAGTCRRGFTTREREDCRGHDGERRVGFFRPPGWLDQGQHAPCLGQEDPI